MEELIRTFPAALNELSQKDQAVEALVFAAWRRSVEAPLADHVVPLRFADGSLICAVESQLWRRQLSDLCPVVAGKLNESLGTPLVRVVKVELDGEAVRSHRDDMARRKQIPDDGQRTQYEAWPELVAAAAAIGDEELRRLFLAAVSGAMARRSRLGI